MCESVKQKTVAEVGQEPAKSSADEECASVFDVARMHISVKTGICDDEG